MISYEKIILQSQNFTTQHQSINEFGNGDLSEVVERNKMSDFTYPMLWMQDLPFSNPTEKVDGFSFKILVMDKVIEVDKNENFVKSQMNEILNNFISYFKQGKFYDVDGNLTPHIFTFTTSKQSFSERFGDTLTGWSKDVTFTFPNDLNKCKIPFK